jgi:D-alanyl-D-alanine carboxypeptidase
MSKLPAACAVLALTLPALPVLAASPDPALAQHLDAVISANYAPDAPGATVIVVKDGKTLLRKGYGLADVANKRPLTPETVMRLGSVTKQFTAAAILLLEEKGKLKTGDDIRIYLPDFPDKGKKITIEHLLTHTSGIVNNTNKPAFLTDMAKDFTLAQLIATFKDDPLEFDPGSRFAYSNSGYILLGAIIEKASGQPYDQYLAQHIFTPLGMTHTAYEGHERTSGVKALGYRAEGDTYVPALPISMTQPYAAGALVSNVDDLARWDAAIASGKLLTAATWQKAFTPYTLTAGPNAGTQTDYGAGWSINKLYGMPMINHSGGIPGFMTHVLRLPSEHVYVAVLENADSGAVPPNEVAGPAALLAMGKPYHEHKEIALPAAQLDPYAGVYNMKQTDHDANVTFRRAGDHLTMQWPGSRVVSLRAFSSTNFYSPASLSWLEFGRDKTGKVDRVTFHDVDADRVHVRVGDAPSPHVAVKIDPARFDAHAGRYELMPNFILELTRDGNRYFTQATGQPKIEIFALNDDAFFNDQIGAEIRFDPAAPNQLALDQGGRKMLAKKLP